MASIIELIKNIRNARLGKDVRESIASAIEQTYEDASKDGNANMEVSEARGTFETLEKRLNNSDSVKAEKTEVSDIRQQLNVERERINNITQLEEGSTTGDAELADMRIGADGTTYNNAGNSVREQINNINYSSFNIKSLNLWLYGGLDNTNTNRLKTPFLNTKNIFYMYVTNINYELLLYAFKENMEKIGYWNGNNFNNNQSSTSQWVKSINIAKFKNIYPNYNFKVVFRHISQTEELTETDYEKIIFLFSKNINYDTSFYFSNNDFCYGQASSNSIEGSLTDQNHIISKPYVFLQKGTHIYNKSQILNNMGISLFNKEGKPLTYLGFSKFRNSLSVTLDDDYYIRFTLANKNTSSIQSNEFLDLFNETVGIELNCNLSKNGLIQHITNSDNLPISSMTKIKNLLYIFSYSLNDDHTEMITNNKYRIANDGSLHFVETFQSNLGHANTVDYNENNDCLIAGNGGSSTNTQPNEIYIFPNASSLEKFDVNSEDCIRINVSQLGWGKQLNCVWDKNGLGGNNVVYCFTNYQQGNMTEYLQNNTWFGEDVSARFIRKIVLGIGSNKLQYGDFNNMGSNKFNGTFNIEKIYEREFNTGEANNDTCFYNNKIYEMVTKIGNGVPFFVHEFIHFGETLKSEKILLPFYQNDGTPINIEFEGIEIYNDILYFGNYNSDIYAVRFK